MNDRENRALRPRVNALEERCLLSALTPVPGTAVLTPHEAARDSFRAAFTGSFTTGPGRTLDQRLLVHITSDRGGSTTSSHTNLRLGVSIPVDPNGAITGQALIIDRNVNSSSSLLVLDLSGVPGAVDRAGRPTLLTWTVNSSSGGIYTDSTGGGTVQIHYQPGGKLSNRVTQAGNAAIVFTGQLAVTGLAGITT